jgi:hypothetical protein
MKAMYGDHRKGERRRPVSPDPSETDSDKDGSAESASESEVEPPRPVPSGRHTKRARVEPEGSRGPETQRNIEDAIEMLRSFGIETVTPNGCK